MHGLRSVLAALVCAAAVPGTAAAQSSYVALSPALAAWKQEIERTSGGKLVLARVYTDPLRNEMSLPGDTADRDVLRGYLLEESFRVQLSAAHALTVNHKGPEGTFHFVVLNMALADQWSGTEDALLADEFGHSWLSALGYGLPAFRPGDRACIAIQAGDTVQHVLIRAEIRRRGLPYDDYWRRTLDQALEALQTSRAASVAAPPCQKLAQLAFWLDAGLDPSTQRWPKLPEFRKLLSQKEPKIPGFAAAIEPRLKALQTASPLPPPRDYAKTVDFVVERFTAYYDGS